MQTVKIGEAKIVINAHGCMDCGTLWARHWEVARTVEVTVGIRKITVGVHRCEWCAKRATENTERKDHG